MVDIKLLIHLEEMNILKSVLLIIIHHNNIHVSNYKLNISWLWVMVICREFN